MTWFHYHRWKLNAVQHAQRVTIDRTTGQRHNMGDATRLLLVCDCGKAMTRTIDGTWTISELQPKPFTADVDQDFLRSLKIKP